MEILITGGNGFVGSHLCERLASHEDNVSILDLSFNNVNKVDCEKTCADVRDYDAVKKAVEGKDTVFHFAAVSRVAWGQQDPIKCWSTNLSGTVNVLEACHKSSNRPKVFFASSREVYGDPEYLPVNEIHPKKPKSIYGASKLSAEQICSFYHDAFGLDVVIFRLSNVYGSLRDHIDRVIPRFISRALRNEDLVLSGGNQVIDFIFIDDAISGILKAYKKSMNDSSEVSGKDFNIASGAGIPVTKLAGIVTGICNSRSRIIRVEPNKYDVEAFIGDVSKANRILAFEPQTRLESGLAILRDEMVKLPNLLAPNSLDVGIGRRVDP